MTRLAPATIAGYPDPGVLDSRWTAVQSGVAALAALVIGTRYFLYTQVSVGYLVAFALTPVWLPLVLRSRAARWLFGAAVAALLTGYALSLWRSRDHEVSQSMSMILLIEMLGILASAGCLFWVIRIIKVAPTVVCYGLGMLLFVNRNSNAYDDSPWRFGFALPASVLLLGLAAWSGRRWLEVATLLLLCVASLATGARSSFAIQLIALLTLALWISQRKEGRRPSALYTIGMLAGLGLAVYNLTQAFNLEGLLGEAAQARTNAQLDASGNLLLGGRPELGATLALMANSPIGFGLGVLPNWQDMQVARAGMAAIGYDPLNGYVDNYMFGGAFRLHSIIGELWVIYGIVGLVLGTVLLVTAIQGISLGSRPSGADGLVLVLSFQTLWNCLFSPWYSSIPTTVLLLPLVWGRLEEARVQRGGVEVLQT